ncbi:MAG: hypothetical protein IBJ03_06435 [Gemmatimonadaceae bacterium]|nr:hypothetical protein [Gemmatimonadaceae bacterium]
MQALDEFIESFLGYGNLRSPLWFLGMEEGGGRDVAELARRVALWDSRGRSVCEDLAEYHRAMGVGQFFDRGRPKLQPTWCALMKALQAWRGESYDLDTLRRVQATELGTSGGATALLELLPLPSPKASDWTYRELATRRGYLADRSSYVSHVLPRRIGRLHQVVRDAQPKAVVCYGLSYVEHWRAVAGTSLDPVTIGDRQCLSARVDRTQFLIVPHPSRANATRLWEAIGHQLRATAL